VITDKYLEQSELDGPIGYIYTAHFVKAFLCCKREWTGNVVNMFHTSFK